MAQDGTTAGGASYTIDNVTFPIGRTKLQSIFNAIRTNNKGASAPDLVAGQFWIDDNTPSTTVWTLYFYDGTDSIQFATIDTINNTVNFIDSTFDLINDTTPELGGNLSLNSNDITGTGNINITGTATVTGLTTTGDINFGDNDKAQFGASQDLQIYHDSNHSYIDDVGTGSIFIRADDYVLIDKSDGSKRSASFNTDDAVILNFNNNQKFTTTSTGIDVTGNASADIINIYNASTQGRLNVSNNGAEQLEVFPGDVSNKVTLQAFNRSTVASSSFRYIASTHEFTAGGSERMRIDSDGNVGIGTSSPTALLTAIEDVSRSALTGTGVGQIHISGGATPADNDVSSITFSTNNTTTASSIIGSQLTNNGSNLFFGTSGNYAAGVNNTAMFINYAGNVGIGTSSPTGRLTVDGGASQTDIQIESDVASNIKMSVSSTDYFRIYTSPSDTQIRNLTANPMIFRTTDTDRIQINGNGDISFYEDTGTTPKLFWDASAESLGIGTTSPSEKINISTKIGLQDDPDAIGLGSSYSNTAGSPSRLKVKVYDAGGDNANGLGHSAGLMNIVSGLSGHDMAFFTNGGGGSTERMRIDSSGNVGIGTSSPSSPLHIKTTGSSGTETEVLRLETTGTNDGSGITIDMRTSHINTQIAMVDGSGSYDGNIVFRTAGGSLLATPTERMRIDSSGGVNLCKGNFNNNVTASNHGWEIFQNSTAPFIQHGSAGTGFATKINFFNGNGDVGKISTNGSATTYATSSDYRLKENVVDIPNATERLKQLSPKRFNFIADADTTVDGFLAHEVQSVVPEAVTGTHNEVDSDGNPVYQGIDQSKLVPLLVASLKEALTEIDNLKARVDTLEGN
jgi:hypothetical protein